jgi:hypothetical protein
MHYNSLKTHCPRRHEYTEENTYIRPKAGRRHCKTCIRISRSERTSLTRRFTRCEQCWGPLSKNRVKYCTDCAPEDGYRKWKQLLGKYGVDAQMWNAMYFEQDGSCLLCPEEATVLDHCHKTGKPRGLLCHPCNAALGHIEKDDWLFKAYTYLKEA